MDYEIQHNPSYSVVEVRLQSGESIVGDSGAMAWMDSNVRTITSTRGGVLTGLKRKLLSGESFFQNTYTAEGGEGMVAFTPGSAGAVVGLKMEGTDLYLEKAVGGGAVEIRGSKGLLEISESRVRLLNGDGWQDVKLEAAKAKFVKVYIDSYWAIGGGLNEVQVYSGAK